MGVGVPVFVGSINQVIEPLGESKSGLQIAAELAEHLGITDFMSKQEREILDQYALGNGVTDLEKFRAEATHHFQLQAMLWVSAGRDRKAPDEHPLSTRGKKKRVSKRG